MQANELLFSLPPTLYSLVAPPSRYPPVHPPPTAFSRSNVTDSEIEQLIDATVSSLFSVFATIGSVPIIRCPRGNAAEMVATRLDAKFRDSLRDSRHNLFSGGGGGGESMRAGTAAVNGPNPSGHSTAIPHLFQRPLLVLLDRQMDLASPLHHSMTYQSLVHDVFVSARPLCCVVV